MPVSSSTEHWIKPDALTINLNHFGDPDYLQVSVLAGAVVMAFKQDVIGYNAAHNYRTWPLEAANTYLETTSAVNVYAKLTRSEVNARALIVYDTVLRDIEGREITYAENGSEVLREASTDYFFVFLGQISESTDRNGGKKERSWNIGFRFGALDTTEQKNYTGFLFEKMFRPHYDDNQNPDKITSIEILSGLWTHSFISAKGISPNNGGESSSGLIRQVFGYNDLSGNFLNSDLNNTFNAYTIARLASRISYLEQNGGGSGGGGVADSIEWEKVLYKPSWLVDKKPSVSFFENDAQYITSDALNPYATQQWVNDKGYAIATDVANTYVTKTTFNTLKTDFDNLSALLNDDVQGKINTWHEVVDFLDEYSGSKDLATILSTMNADISSRLEKTKFAEYFNSEMAKWFVKDDGNKGIKPVNSYGLYSDTYVSAKGVSTGASGGGGGTSYDRLDSWAEYTSAKAGYVLSALLGYDLNTRVNNLANAGYITESALSGYAKLSDIPTSLPASDVAAWAKAASKPSYAFSEITNKPTTLSGYGITDAYTSSVIDGKLSGYLPLSGGTLTDTLTINRSTYPHIVLNSTADNGESCVRFTLKSVTKGYVGYSSSLGVYLQNSTTYKQLNLYDDGSLSYGGSTIWHEGNDGSGSGLDADLLDGYHANSSGNKPWGTIPVVNSSGWMEVGKQLEFHYDNTTNSDYSTLLKCTGNHSNAVNLPSSSGTIALTTDNVSSATKLQTSRTIWGQSFDGTGDVSGNIHLGNGTTFEIGTGYNTSNPTRYNKIVFGAESSGLQYISGSWTSDSNVVAHDFKVGIGNTTALAITNEGNVLIGTTSPTEKLHVDGNILGKAYLTNGNYGIWRGVNFTGALTVNDLAYYANFHVFLGNVGIGTDSPTEKLYVVGNIVATGSVTAKSSSDYRLKCKFDYNVDYQERLLSLGKVCDFNYTPHAQEREFALADDKRHTSVIWQDARKANITGFCSVEEDGYGTINPLSSDLIFTMVGAIQQGIVKTERIEERVVRLEEENAALRKEINDMKGGRHGC